MPGPDWGATAGDYARYRAGFPDSFFERLATYEVGLPFQQLVDLGTGTGSLAEGFAARGCRVVGIDPDQSMIAEARRLSSERGRQIDYRVASAEQTDLPDRFADVVTAGQCWHWFDSRRAAREVERILRPSGRLVLAHFDWIPLAGNVVRATEELIERHNPNWSLGWGSGTHTRWLRDLAEAGYRKLETFSYDMDVCYSPAAWRGRIRASAGVAGSLAAEEVRRFDEELGQRLAEDYATDELSIPHRVFALIACHPGEAV